MGYHVTIGYEKITKEYITQMGRESLLVLALISRNITLRKEMVFNLDWIYTKLQISNRSIRGRESIVKTLGAMYPSLVLPQSNELVATSRGTLKGQYLIINDRETDNIINNRRKGQSVYNLFNTYLVIKRFVNNETGLSFPSIDTIKNITNVGSNNTTLKCIQELEALGLIECIRYPRHQQGSVARRPNNEYRIVTKE